MKTIEQIKKAVLSKSETIAVAESVTSGVLQTAFAAANGAEKFYQGGITTYNLGQKCRHLLVDPIKAESCNCVSKKVAEEMALGVCKLFSSDFGIGITGYATPIKESQFKLFCYFALTYRGKVIASKKVMAQNGDAKEVQMFYAQEVLKEFGHYLG